MSLYAVVVCDQAEFIVLLTMPYAQEAEWFRDLETVVADWLDASQERAYLWVCHDEEQRLRIADRCLEIREGTLG